VAAILALLEDVIGGTHKKNVSLREQWAGNLLELADEVYDRIMRWDVRQAGKLLELFPGYVPKNKQGQPFRVELVDNEAGTDCDWVLIW